MIRIEHETTTAQNQHFIQANNEAVKEHLPALKKWKKHITEDLYVEEARERVQVAFNIHIFF